MLVAAIEVACRRSQCTPFRGIQFKVPLSEAMSRPSERSGLGVTSLKVDMRSQIWHVLALRILRSLYPCGVEKMGGMVEKNRSPKRTHGPHCRERYKYMMTKALNIYNLYRPECRESGGRPRRSIHMT